MAGFKLHYNYTSLFNYFKNNFPQDFQNLSGSRFLIRCPSLNHGTDGFDTKPSLQISQTSDGRCWLYCYSGCGREDIISGLKERYNLFFQQEKKKVGITLEELFGDWKGKAQKMGVYEGIYQGRNAVIFTLFTPEGSEHKVYRVGKLEGEKTLLEKGAPAGKLLYLSLNQPKEEGVLICESYFDAFVASLLEFNSIGGVGWKNTLRAIEAWESILKKYLEGYELLVWEEHDVPGFGKTISRILGRAVKLIKIPFVELKDIARLFWQYDIQATEKIRELIRKAEIIVPFDFPLICDVYGKTMELHWIIENFFCEGDIVLLAGRPQIGKTTVALNILKACETGDSFLGLKAKKVNCGFLNTEKHQSTLQKSKLLGLKQTIYLHSGREELTIESLKDLQKIIEFYNLRLLVIDHLCDFLKPKISSPQKLYDFQTVRNLMNQLRRVSEATGCAIILIHHLKKHDKTLSEIDEEAVLGSTALPACSDVVALIFKKTGRKYLRISGNALETEQEICFDFENDNLNIIEIIDQTKTSKTKKIILELLRTEGGKCFREITEYVYKGLLDTSYNTCRSLTIRCLKKMQEEGLVGKKGNIWFVKHWESLQ